MKTMKLRIISLFLAIALSISGAYVTKVYAEGTSETDPQKPPGSPVPGTESVDPDHCALCYVRWLLGI
jgi:hypothetical protein